MSIKPSAIAALLSIDELDETAQSCGDLAMTLSDDIWNKFELDFPLDEELCDLDNIIYNDFEDLSLQNSTRQSSLSFSCFPIDEIRNHDCMWAGHCGSKEHSADDTKLLLRPTFVPEKTPVQKQPVPAGRSLLLKTVVKPPTAAAPVVPSPESPPMSDDEESKSRTITLQMLHEAISECDLEDDSDLCEYFEEGEDLIKDPIEEETKPRQNYARQITDHSYHKDKNASMRISDLGIETPSDSGRSFLLFYFPQIYSIFRRNVQLKLKKYQPHKVAHK